MQFSERDLQAAVKAGALDASRLKPLLDFLGARASPGEAADAPAPRFDLAHILWYAGALIVIGAMGTFSTLAFSQMGGKALTVTAIVYALVFTVMGHYFWYKRNLRTPGGLLIAIAVSMAPLAVFGVQSDLGIWTQATPRAYRDFYQWVSSSFLYMEVAAIAAACVALYFYRFPFIVSIIAVALWFMSMDLVQLVNGTPNITWEMRRSLSMWFGIGVLIVAWIVDMRQRKGDFAFWLHLFGMMAFWSGLSLSDSNSQVAKALYCLLNVVLIFLGAFLGRRVYAVFGTLGVAGYLGNLSYSVFRDSMLFPFALSLVGVAVIAIGLFYFRRQEAIAAWLDARLPDAVKALRPMHVR